MTTQVHDLKCSSCGASLEMPNNAKGHVKCPYCGTDCIISGILTNSEINAKKNISSGVPLCLTPPMLHKMLVSCLHTSIFLPLDAYDKIKVIREEQYCVPGYCFHCNGTTSISFEVGNKRKHDKKTYTEWRMEHGNISTSATLIVSGNRELASAVNAVYIPYESIHLVGAEALEFPHDVTTCDCNVPAISALNEYVKPHLEQSVRRDAEKLVANRTTRNLIIGGINIQREDETRVSLGLYRIVYEYENTEYSIWVSGDGKHKAWITSDGRCVPHDGLPLDENRKKILTDKRISLRKTENIGCAFVALAIACFVLALFYSALFYVGTFIFVVLLVITIIKGKKQKAIFNEFTEQLLSVQRNFNERKKPLQGIYENVEWIKPEEVNTADAINIFLTAPTMNPEEAEELAKKYGLSN